MRNIHFLIKPASSLCNLRCRYCFYEDVAENRTEKCMGIMQGETMDELLREAYRTIEPRGRITFSFQGGEPTVAGLDFFREFVRKAREGCPGGVRLEYAIQTNGTLLTEEWIQFFLREDFLVGISIDGYKDIHNRNRVDARGEDTWKLVRQQADRLLKAGVRTNALCVVTGQCAKHPEKVYRELKKIGFDYIQFIACLDPIGMERGKMPYSVMPEDYGKFLCRTFDLWYQDWEQGNYHSIRLFDDYIHVLLGDGGSTCATCGKCGGYFVVEGDGSVYPCDFFVLDEWQIGKIGVQSLEEMGKSERFQSFLQWGTDKPEECSACPWKRLCNGGCKNDWITTENGVHNYYCRSFQMLFEHGAERMMRIARAEREARQRYAMR